MELFGIAFSIPGAFAVSALYRFVLLGIRKRWLWIRPLFLSASGVVLAAVIVEWVLLAERGATGTRALLGPVYYTLHTWVFFLGTPALMNVLVLPNPEKWQARWWSSLHLCTILAFILVLQQYMVSEALFGIE